MERAGSISTDTFIVSGYCLKSDSIFALFFKYDINGDIVDSKQYPHPFDATSAILDEDFAITPDGGYLLCTSIRLATHTDYYLIKTDSFGNIIWDYSYGNSRWDIPMSVIIDEANGNIIVGGIKTNQNFVTSNYDFQTYIIGLDSLGNELWTYLSPNAEGLRDGAKDMILLEDGSLIVASGIGYEQERPSFNVVWYEKSVFRLNPNQEVVWEKEFKDITLSSVTKTTNLINTYDQSGVLVAGTSAEDLPGTSTFVVSGWLAKLSYDGDSLWSRRFVYLDNQFNHHEFYDLKETPDGGFILCGESRDREDDAIIPQQAWLLKLDSYGCLIPGCHLIDDVRETETVSYELKLYPNPTSDYLNIFMRHHRGSQKFTFRIRNGVGQQVAEFKQIIQEETLMIDLMGYSSGIYYLEVMQNGEILETEKFIVN